MSFTRALIVLLALAAPTLAEDRPAFPTGEPASGSTTSEEPAIYQFEAPAAGVLLVMATSEARGADLAIRVTDDEGQTLAVGGTADNDFITSRAKEAAAIPLTGPGKYLVQVVCLSSGEAEQVEFKVVGTFLANPAFARAVDPDGRPSQAKAIELGAEAGQETLGPDDLWDWFVVRPTSDGTLILKTTAPEGDFFIEVYTEGRFDEPQDRADNDDDEVYGNEQLEVTVTKGQTIYLRVTLRPDQERTADLPYRVSAGFAPN
jgi:hypothetical protein